MKKALLIIMMVVVVISVIAAQSGVLAAGAKAKKSLDAVLEWKNGKMFFFKGGRFVRFDLKAHRVDPDYPKAINNETWPGLPWRDGIDAAFNLGNGKAYIFKGSQYVRWDVTADRIDPGYPKPISTPSAWPGLPWTDGFDSVINLGSFNGKLYFFKGSQYVRYDIKADRADSGYPKPISTSSAWPGLPWTDGFDTAVNWGNGKLYFFKGNEYVQYDIKTDRADPGYPKTITQLNWPGLASLIHEIIL